MQRSSAKKIARSYADALMRARFPFRHIYLFGSHAKGKSAMWSDIDVAVVSDRLKRNCDVNRWLLWQIRMEVDKRIEPHGFTVREFSNIEDPMVHEIRKTGIRID